MFKRTLLILLAALSFDGPAVFAASDNNKVAILYDGNTETNRETIGFIRKHFRANGIGYNLSYLQDPSQIKAGQYRAVVVLSTGLTSGLDSKLAAFVNGYSAKGEIVLISLLAGSQSMNVTSLTAKQSAQGVDAISSASIWGRSSSIVALHENWVNQMVKLIEAR